ncbi:hypothetical protein ACQ86O_20180 [Serratia sp. L9]|uniref:hypothetical protein n=1 Tax=Serratia sp. L9 TaxID=3423946 RepID=UPI003D67BF17
MKKRIGFLLLVTFLSSSLTACCFGPHSGHGGGPRGGGHGGGPRGGGHGHYNSSY